MIFSVGAAFMVSILAVDYLMIDGAFMRLILRIAIQIILYSLIFLAFDSLDLAARLRESGGEDDEDDGDNGCEGEAESRLSEKDILEQM